MSSWVPISRTEHAKHTWRTKKGYEFAAGQQIVSVLLAEAPKILPHYVSGFVQADDGSFDWVVLVGVGGERNLYVTPDSHWFCSYIPANLRAYPFALMKDEEGKAVLCLEESYLTTDSDQNRLFQEDGELDPSVAQAVEFIGQCEKNRQITRLACESLKEAGLIKPWPITISRGDDVEPLNIEGMHCVDEEKLNNISGESLVSIRNTGALLLAYSQILSTAQMDQLTLRANYLAKSASKQVAPVNLDSLLNEEDSGSLSFDGLDFDNLGSDKQ